MQFLPHRAFEVRTLLAHDEVLRIIAGAVEPRRFLRFGAGTRPFEGTVSASSFDIQRIISYRNSFLPQVHGDVAPEPAGSRVSVTMRLHAFVKVFIAVWVSGVLSIGTGLIIAAVNGQIEREFAALPIGMLLFVWILTTAAFSFEARKAEELLRALLPTSD